MKYIFSIVALMCIIAVCKAQNADFTKENEMDLHTIKQVYARYAIDEHPSAPVDADLIGIWKMKEDTDPHNYFVIERFNDSTYAFTYMNHGGSNRTFENVSAYFSRVHDADFLNVVYYDWDLKISGYFFLRVISMDERGFEMTLALVADNSLKDIPDQQGVHKRIAKNVNKPDFYKQPVHFEKILPLMYCR